MRSARRTSSLTGKITLNAAAFYYNYANMQYQEEDPVPYQGGVSNIPKTHIWGAEAEASFQATHRLSSTAT
jgi:iron complex outermembrane receptor protein